MKKIFICIQLMFASILLKAQTSYDTIPYIPDHWQERINTFAQEPMSKGNIVCIGNSITEFGDWKEIFDDSTAINRGIAGDITFGLLHRLDEVIQRKPSKLFIEAGINDISKNIPDAIVSTNIFSIVRKVHALSPTTQVFVYSILPTNDSAKNDYPGVVGKSDHIVSINKSLKQNARKMNYIFIDIYSKFKDKHGNLIGKCTDDGLHPNVDGYKLWKRVLQEEGILKVTETYIVNAKIIDVKDEKILSGLIVGIKGDLITEIGKIKVPVDAKQIDAKGKYLMPGLVDAHVHFFQSGGLYTRPDIIDLTNEVPYQEELDKVHNNFEEQLRRYVSCGITSVFDVGASEHFLEQRKEFIDKQFAPGIFMTGPLLTTYIPAAFKDLKKDEISFALITSVDEARQAVKTQIPFAPDFIKIWYIVDEKDKNKIPEKAQSYFPVIKAAIEEAHANNLKVAVHATELITATLAAEAGADYLVHSVDDTIVNDSFIHLLKDKNIIVCPTLSVEDGYELTFGQRLHFSNYEIKKSDPFALGSLMDLQHLQDTGKTNLYKRRSDASTASTNRRDSIRRINLKKLEDAGVTIVSGTDAGNIGTLHAASYYSELEKMYESGLNNWEVLQASTINASKILNKENNIGSITVGNKADLILLNANPVDSLSSLKEISFVINKGKFVNPDMVVHETPEMLIQRQLNAYNAHNLEAFLDTYSDSIQVFIFPNKLVCDGKVRLKKAYEFLNHSPRLHCQIMKRIVKDNIIIDKEHIMGVNDIKDGVAVYEVENNRIKRVYFFP